MSAHDPTAAAAAAAAVQQQQQQTMTHDSASAAATAAAAAAAAVHAHNPNATLALTAQQQQDLSNAQNNSNNANSIFTQSSFNAAAAAAAAASQAAALGGTQRKSTKATWSTADDLELIRQLRLQRENNELAHKANGGTPSILGNRGITWSQVEAGMEKYRQEKGFSEGKYDALACRNRWQLLLLQYRVVADIKNQPGFVWSDTEGARMVPSHLWDHWVNSLDTAHKIRIAKIFRLKGYPLFNEVASLAGDPAFLNGSSSSQHSNSNGLSYGFGANSKPATPAAARARASLGSQYSTPGSGTQWSASKRRNTGSQSHNHNDAASFDASFAALSDASFGASAALDPNEQLIQQAQRRVRNESAGLSISQKVTLTNLFRQDLTAVWTYMAIGDNEDEFRLAWLKEEVERANLKKVNEIAAAANASANVAANTTGAASPSAAVAGGSGTPGPGNGAGGPAPNPVTSGSLQGGVTAPTSLAGLSAPAPAPLPPAEASL
ncbi:hypothetical protein OC846_001356 [Tilletia horrida]|uniref:Myb-like domain-containing protein n=1 Tax=Tilletia horrida TaxID=155126 RepID=A0AAN6GT41_9BASI|nr:hypothetical protein OC845_003549 [Tilletia horrida]KAK0556137.1 hypothetical protein OC846_001356 [Tilletia horrida]KAK0569063.1 hypothetical protein OC861_001305 [Tilletia horrida]